MSPSATSLRCTGCGAAPPEGEPYPFRCPNAGSGDVDHVLGRLLDTGQVVFPGRGEDDPSPFVRFRRLLHSYHRAIAGGLGDAGFVELVRRLDARVVEVDGRGFRETPFGRSEPLSDALGFSAPGGVWVKDETHNVAGSHKGRHLMGILLHLEVAELLGLPPQGPRPDLGVASCGNAALAAAVLARASNRRLRAFVPPGADAGAVERILALGAEVVVCERGEDLPGDPSYRALLAAVGEGTIPFTCQGSLNGLAIEGGETLAFEIASAQAEAGEAADHVVLQVGGGALASAVAQGLAEARALGADGGRARLHTVQSTAVHPLERAARKVAALLPGGAGPEDLARALALAAGERSRYMWPWGSGARSLATGILDEETYDWLAVVAGMLSSGGEPVVVEEAGLLEANELAATCGLEADATGTSGIAGLMKLVDSGVVRRDERVVVLATGSRR